MSLTSYQAAPPRAPKVVTHSLLANRKSNSVNTNGAFGAAMRIVSSCLGLEVKRRKTCFDENSRNCSSRTIVFVTGIKWSSGNSLSNSCQQTCPACIACASHRRAFPGRNPVAALDRGKHKTRALSARHRERFLLGQRDHERSAPVVTRPSYC